MAVNTINPTANRRQKIILILTLALPAVIENFLQTAVGFIDTLFVARLGIKEVAAVGLTNAVIAVYMAVFMAVGIGAASIIARAIGAGELERAKQTAGQAVLVSVIAGLLFGVLTAFFAERMLILMGADSGTAALGAVYFRIVGIPSVFISVSIMLGSILRAAGDTKTPMKISFYMNIVHIALDYVLIFGIFGFSGFGLEGAAWATVITRAVGTFVLFRYLRKSSLSFSFVNTFSTQYILPIVRLSTPTAIERLISRLGRVAYFGLIVYIGTETYAAHIIAGNIEIVSYMPGYGLAAAATILVSQHYGANHIAAAKQYAALTIGIAICFMTLFGLLLYLLSPWLAAWFTKEEEVIGMVVTALKINAFAQPALAVGLVLTGVLQGIGDTKSPMYSTAAGMWVVRVSGVYFLGIQMGLGIAGVWLSIAMDLFARAVYLLYRFKVKMPK